MTICRLRVTRWVLALCAAAAALSFGPLASAGADAAGAGPRRGVLTLPPGADAPTPLSFEPLELSIAREDLERTLSITGGVRADLRVRPAGAGDDLVSIEVPLEAENAVLVLRRESVFADDAVILIQHGPNEWEVRQPEDIRTYRGEIVGAPGSMVAATIENGAISGMIMLPDGSRYWVEPLEGRIDGAREGEHAVFRGSDILCREGSCGVPGEALNARAEELEEVGLRADSSGCDGLCVADLAIDTDHEYYLLWQPSISVVSRITSLINAVNVQFEAEVGIRHRISTIVVRETAADPYPDITDMVETLRIFTGEWAVQNFPGVTRDLGILFSGKSYQQYVGYAFGGVCSDNARCIVTQHSSVLACVTCVVAHELGHVWTASHCQCPASTMLATVNCQNTFLNNPDPANQSVTQITNHRDSRTCLSSLEGTRITIPWSDSFAGPSFDAAKWSGVSGAAVNTLGVNEPSAPSAANLKGGTSLRSAFSDTSYLTNIQVSFKVQPTGGGNAPETGDDLELQWRDASGVWNTAWSSAGRSLSPSSFTPFTATLPGAASYMNFRMRWRNTGNEPGGDDWFVDDFAVTGTAQPIGAFSIITPSASLTDLKPPLSWSAALNATSYRVLIDDSPAFTSPELDRTIPTTQMAWPTDVPALAPGRAYTVKIIASNPVHSLERTRAITTISGAPGPISITNPANNSYVVGSQVSIRWGATANAVQWTLQVDDSPSFTAPLVVNVSYNDSTILQTNFSAALGTYYARVSSTNTLGASTSPVVQFTVAPVNNIPAACSIIDQAPVQLWWPPVAGATSYKLDVFDQPSYLVPPRFTRTGITGITTTLSASDPWYTAGTTAHYTWRITANMPGGSTFVQPSSDFTFMTPVTTGSSFRLTQPAHQSVIHMCQGYDGIPVSPVMFRWTFFPGAASYTLQTDTTPDFTTPEFSFSGITGIQYAAGSNIAMESSTVWWRVIAHNSSGAVLGATAPWLANIFLALPRPTGPGAFSLAAPKDGANIMLPIVRFKWNHSDGAEKYDLIVADDETLANPELIVPNLALNTTSISTGLLDPSVQTHWWAVVARSEGGETRSSEVWSFSANPETDTIDPLPPSGGEERADAVRAVMESWGADVEPGLCGDVDLDGHVGLADLIAVLTD